MKITALALGELTEIKGLVSAGHTKSIYSMVAQSLVPHGYGWAQATGVMKKLFPDFNSLMFADMWYNPYQRLRQTQFAERTDYSELLEVKSMIEQPLKEATRYMYSVSYDIYDPDGEFITKVTVSYYDDELMSPEDVEYRAKQVFSQVTKSNPYPDSDYHFEGVAHNEGWDYQ